jgi:guanine deaminase
MSATSTNEDHRWLRHAVELATANVADGQRPYAAVIIRDGDLLAEATNTALRDNDPTAHAELLAIRVACATLGSLSLARAVIYASGQPCPMCQAAALLSGVSRMVFAAPATEAARARLLVPHLAPELARPLEARKEMPVEHLDLPGAAVPFDAWLGQAHRD